MTVAISPVRRAALERAIVAAIRDSIASTPPGERDSTADRAIVIEIALGLIIGAVVEADDMAEETGRQAFAVHMAEALAQRIEIARVVAQLPRPSAEIIRLYPEKNHAES